MKKHVYGRKFSRDRGGRTALFRALITSFIKAGQIKTTLPRAKAIKGSIDKLVTLARKNTLYARRRIIAELADDKTATHKLMEEAQKRFANLSSGFTKIIRIGQRRGDNALMVRLMWSREKVEDNKEEQSKSRSKSKTK